MASDAPAARDHFAGRSDRESSRPRVVVVGLGPAGPELITAEVRAAIETHPRRFLRTRRHPAAVAMEPAVSFDSLYESATSLEQVYEAIVETLVAEAVAGPVLYGVPGSASVAERTVARLRHDPRVTVEVLASLSFVDLVWDRLGIDPLNQGVTLVDGHRFGVEAAGGCGPWLVAQCDSTLVMSDIKLVLGEVADADPEAVGDVTILSRLGLADEEVRRLHWAELDRSIPPDHLTSVFIPRLGTPVAPEMARFADLVRDLRQRCPWDRAQTHFTLTRHLVEESYEVLEAIAGLPADEAWDLLCEELGDVLFQVVFHSTLAAEAGRFTLADVARGVHDKLVARHPHVFAPDPAVPHDAPDTAEAVLANWEQAKLAEKGRSSVMDGIPPGLPALALAAKVQRKAESAGAVSAVGPGEAADQTRPEAVARAGAKVPGVGAQEEADETLSEAAARVGAELFGAVARARAAGVDPEAALAAFTQEFRRTFQESEAATRPAPTSEGIA